MFEKDFTVEDARTLLSKYAPKWAQEEISQLTSAGTDNALFMLGQNSVLRIPKREAGIQLLSKELIWLPVLGTLPLSVPKILFHGQTQRDIGFDFGIFRWEQGDNAILDRISNPQQAAETLAHFLSALRKVNTDGAPIAGPENNHRGVALTELTAKTLASIDILADEINTKKARALWESACSATSTQRLVWVHGDLKADNMIAYQGRLKAVIDWGLAAIGDPAVDTAVAWTWVDPSSREAFWNKLNAPEAEWNRAKGWALYCAVIALSYYRGRSHTALCEQSRLTLKRLELT